MASGRRSAGFASLGSILSSTDRFSFEVRFCRAQGLASTESAAVLSHSTESDRHHPDEANRKDVTARKRQRQKKSEWADTESRPVILQRELNVQEQDWLAERFEQNRGHLRGVAYRMLGSLNEADDAIQEAWLRLSRSGADDIENLAGWLTTVVSRVCLDMLRSRKARREESIEAQQVEKKSPAAGSSDPESEALLADSVGVALLVILDRLAPAERLAFVLHDLFAVSFEEIGGILGRSAMAARQLASRARRRVQGAPAVTDMDRRRQSKLVDRLMTALRAGDVPGMVAVLDPDFVLHVDEASVQPDGLREIRGAEVWARQAVVFAKGAHFVEPVLVDGAPGVLLAPHGRLMRVLRFTFAGDRITGGEVIGDKEHLEQLDLSVIETDAAANMAGE